MHSNCAPVSCKGKTSSVCKKNFFPIIILFLWSLNLIEPETEGPLFKIILFLCSSGPKHGANICKIILPHKYFEEKVVFFFKNRWIKDCFYRNSKQKRVKYKVYFTLHAVNVDKFNIRIICFWKLQIEICFSFWLSRGFVLPLHIKMVLNN